MWVHACAGALAKQEGPHAGALLLAQLPSVLLECIMDCLVDKEKNDLAAALTALTKAQAPKGKAQARCTCHSHVHASVCMQRGNMRGHVCTAGKHGKLESITIAVIA